MTTKSGSESMRDLPVKLTEEVIKTLREELPGEELKLGTLRAESLASTIARRVAKKQENLKIEEQQAAVTKIAKEIESGERIEPVPCQEFTDFPTERRVERLDVAPGDPRRVISRQTYTPEEIRLTQQRDAQQALGFPEDDEVLHGSVGEDKPLSADAKPGEKRKRGEKKADGAAATH